MNLASSSVGFPLTGSPQSPQNPPPLHRPTSGIPHPENPQATVTSSTSNPSYPPDPYCKGQPTFVVSAEDWNVEMTKLFHDEHFKYYMCGGECRHHFMDWYVCMKEIMDHNGNWGNCSEYAGYLRDCVFANLRYYKPLLRICRTGLAGNRGGDLVIFLNL